MLRLETGLRFVLGNTSCLTTRVYIFVEKSNHKPFLFSSANVPGIVIALGSSVEVDAWFSVGSLPVA